MIYKWDPPQAKIGPIINLAYVEESQVRKHVNGHYYQYKKLPALVGMEETYEWVRYDLVFIPNKEIREMVSRNDPTLSAEITSLGPALTTIEIKYMHSAFHKKYLSAKVTK